MEEVTAKTGVEEEVVTKEETPGVTRTDGSSHRSLRRRSRNIPSPL